MMAMQLAATGIRKERDASVRYEVHREREDGANGAARPPIVEEHLGLDRARIAALSDALDGPTPTGDRFTGLVRIVQVFYSSGIRRTSEVVDEVDERVASRLLNEVRWPRACELAVPLDRLQADADALKPYAH